MEKNFKPPIYNLGPAFYDEVSPAPFPGAQLRYRNQAAAKIVGLETLTPGLWQDHFWAFKPLPGNITRPLALRYHGHQFGIYNPDLGDGRGFLFAQFHKEDKLWDLGTKGSGQTPYSRKGDGRLTLKGAFREALCTEMLESLGVETSRTFSIFETKEQLERHDEPSPTRSAVLVRLSHGHIRIGTFQRLAAIGDIENLKKLIRFCNEIYFRKCSEGSDSERAAFFLEEVVKGSARLVASYMMAGFVHGVLNTDNINITGESFDYGPYRFIPHYDPNFTAAYFDHSGLYCFGRQPVSFLFALDQLAKSLSLAAPDIPAEQILASFSPHFNTEVQRKFLLRLNLKEKSKDQIENLLTQFFTFLAQKTVPFEQAFFDLFGGWNPDRLVKSPFFKEYEKAVDLKMAFEGFEALNIGLSNHPYFSGCPETLLIDEIEALWLPIAETDDWQPFENKISRLRSFRGLYQI